MATKTRKSAIGIKRPVEKKTLEDRLEIQELCDAIAIDVLQISKYVGSRCYGPARKNQKAVIKRLQQLRL